MIRKKGDEYCLYSKKKGKDGKRKNLGCYSSRAGAEKREREVQYFKHMGESEMSLLDMIREMVREELEEAKGMGSVSNVTKKAKDATKGPRGEVRAAVRKLRRQGKKETEAAKTDYNSNEEEEA